MEPVTIMVAAMTIRSLLGIMVTNLNKVAVYHVTRAWKLSKVLEDLKQSIEIIDAVLEDADNPQSKTKAMEVWLGHLSGLANDANALFDKIITMESEQEMKSKISRVFCKLSYGFKMGKELEKLKGRFDLAIKNRSLTLIPETSKKESSSRMTSCNVIESSIHGRADEKKRVVDELIHGLCATTQLSIYAICGMGGIGKTALAQLVYNDTSVIHHFQLQMWVCVSDNFDVFRLTREILECAGGATPSGSTQRNLNEQSVKSMLQGTRFLLVLDDVWNDDSDKWDELMKLLSFGATGSTVMVTTRAETVVTAIRSPSPGSLFQKVVQKVQGLSEGDSWNMFKWYAFEDQHHIEHESDIMVMGKEMAKKCSGVPLAIKTLGSLMRRKQNVKEWECVFENMHWQDDILPILRLSYSHLPRRLRSCFAYCCIFPKDHVYRKDQMVLLWIANGFVTPQDGKELLDVGNEYFWELADRSLFQDVTESYSAAMYKSRDHAFSWCDDTTFSIHDLMHDLASSSMADTYLTVGIDTKRRIPDKVSHLHLLENFSLENIKKGSLQSLLVSPKFNTQVDSLSSCMLKEKNLMTLDIGGHRSYKRFSVYPVLLSLVLPSINKLRQLRYLDLSFQQDIETLPKSVGSLINLETLKLFGCHNLIELPNNMNHMINLIYLDVRFCDALTHFPPGIGALSNLHILSDKYIADDGAGQDVSILGISNFVGVTEVDSGNKMRNLYSLRLSWLKDFHFGEDGDVCLKRNIMEKIFDGLRPRRDLSNLVIKGYEGPTFPSWITHSYHTFSLTSIRLDGIINCKCLPPLWKLPCLRILGVSGMEILECLFSDELDHKAAKLFSTLETLIIESMPRLRNWTSSGVDGVHFPIVGELHITDSPQLRDQPYCPRIQSWNVTESGLLAVRWPVHSSKLDLEVENCAHARFFSDILKSSNELERLSLNALHGLVSFPPGICTGLSSLKMLDIIGCDSLTSLPEEIHHLSALEHLRVKDCEGLRNSDSVKLLGSLTSLSILEVRNSFDPASLLDAVASLRKLQQLALMDFPDLEQRCERENGPDWSKISHVPYIIINRREMQGCVQLDPPLFGGSVNSIL